VQDAWAAWRASTNTLLRPRFLLLKPVHQPAQHATARLLLRFLPAGCKHVFTPAQLHLPTCLIILMQQ
jgi:hypothetical protein